MNRTDHAAAIIRYATATYASVGSSSSGLALERFTALLLEVLVPVQSGIEGGDFEQRAEQNGLVDRAQAGFDHHAAELDSRARRACARRPSQPQAPPPFGGACAAGRGADWLAAVPCPSWRNRAASSAKAFARSSSLISRSSRPALLASLPMRRSSRSSLSANCFLRSSMSARISARFFRRAMVCPWLVCAVLEGARLSDTAMRVKAATDRRAAPGRAQRAEPASRSETAWGPEAEQACGLAG